MRLHLLRLLPALAACLLCACTPTLAATPPPATATPTAAPTPAPTPSPTPTPVPTPTPDPLDQYFAQPGEYIVCQDFDAWDYWMYMDHTLNVTIRKVEDARAKQTYYVADIRAREGTAFTCAFSNPRSPARSRQVLPYRLARRSCAVYAQNGDFILEEKDLKGILIKNGQLLYEGTAEDTLALLPDGTLKIYSPGETTGEELLAAGVRNTFSFGPTLVRDGRINPDMGEHRVADLKNPRSALGMIEPGHYIGIVVEGRDPKHSVGMTCEELARLFLSYGCTVAYNLDGGASSSMVFMGNSLITHDTYYFGQRSVPDILCIGVCADVPAENAPTQYTGIGDNLPASPPPEPAPNATPEA